MNPLHNNHVPKATDNDILRYNTLITLQDSIENTGKVLEEYHKWILQFPEQACDLPGFQSMQSQLRRIRKKHHTSLPQSFETMESKILENNFHLNYWAREQAMMKHSNYDSTFEQMDKISLVSHLNDIRNQMQQLQTYETSLKNEIRKRNGSNFASVFSLFYKLFFLNHH